MNAPAAPRRSRLQLWLMVAIFFGPIAAALLLYWGAPGLRPAGTTNYGHLIDPARPVPELQWIDALGRPVGAAALRGQWNLIYLGGRECAASCEQRLILIRKVRIALGKDLSRVGRIYLAPDVAALVAAKDRLEAQHPGLKFYADAGAPGRRASDFFAPTDADALYLVDPLGNWLMVYAGEVRPKGLYRDLKKLLRISVIG